MAASRFMLTGSRIGLLAYTLLIPPVFLFLSAAGGASPRKSFREGLVIGTFGLVLALIVTVAVELVEAALWYDTGGIFILDGDTPKSGTSRTAVILNPLALHFVLLQFLIWLPMPVLGAALGSRQPHERVRPSFETQGSIL
jgi:hypothetical protein